MKEQAVIIEEQGSHILLGRLGSLNRFNPFVLILSSSVHLMQLFCLQQSEHASTLQSSSVICAFALLLMAD